MIPLCLRRVRSTFDSGRFAASHRIDAPNQDWAQPTRSRLPGAAIDFATSRAQSMNSFATGLTVRFFTVMTPTGNGGMGNSTGKILNGGRCVPKRSKERGKIPTNDPLATSAQSRWTDPLANPLGGNPRPRARKTSATSTTASQISAPRVSCDWSGGAWTS